MGQSLDQGQSPPAPSAEQLIDQVGVPFTVESADGEGPWRAVALAGRVEGGLLVVATELDQVQASLQRMWLIQVLGSAAVLAALAAVLWWVLHLGVRPLAAMAATADEIAAGDLSRRVDHVDERTEPGGSGSRSTRCSPRSRRRSGSGRCPRPGSGAAPPTPPTSSARH